MAKITSVSTKLNNADLTLEVGRFAERATSSVLAQHGDTIVQVAIVGSRRPTDLGYFPLQVQYQEKLYAGGIIKGSRFVKREGRPTDEAILTGRLIDRSIRPLFPKDYNYDVQITITVLAIDSQHSPDVVAIIATSAALANSDIPWAGPVGAVRIGLDAKTGSLLSHPTVSQISESDLDLVGVATDKAVIMLEAGANQVPDEKVAKALELSFTECQQIVKLINDLTAKTKPVKREYIANSASPELKKQVIDQFADQINKIADQLFVGEDNWNVDLDTIKTELETAFPEANPAHLFTIIENKLGEIFRSRILKDKIRPGGRKIDEIRPISINTGLFHRLHGSAVFQRGVTQALTIATLGSPSREQLLEGMDGESTKRYIHHYNAMPFSVGETGRFGWPSRREVGHGALAERALLPVIPAEAKFPYTIRLVSEIMAQNGSTSMASTCGSTLALMDAGVPITAPVAGVTVGMVSSPTNPTTDYVLLTDIAGLEDHQGDMDLKITGTITGITAMQMDVKSTQILPQALVAAIAQAKVGRLFILDLITQHISNPRPEVSQYAPKIKQIKIPVEKIGELIGPGGKVIKQIIADSGAEVDVDDDGAVSISSQDKTQLEAAITMVKNTVREFEVGEVFDNCKVVKLASFGAFVELVPGKEGMVHVSEMSTDYVNDAADILSVGDLVKVRISKIENGKIGLSMLFGDDIKRKSTNRGPSNRSSRPSFRGHQSNSRRFQNHQGTPKQPSTNTGSRLSGAQTGNSYDKYWNK